ncbi:MAG TPA: ribosome small subunit-dependent GTPase A [Firmicutes bacterium]|uniref:Small ribosomal subunit biogenesis GTPase RsgA n=1 Tax=Capillibacterium thermochitinicola TaxID=2699427 RepID=A0A8J6LRF9_9FIRM|nr:ribosome small subunit-dependent GTPase A [Capillibacterium thermochitinicola]MBA2132047.1 ribosome small subunit-dependent GTPase A [Capillibacterium thermochitinicola]HHW11984.1 ribosome small subunit-dependent GTPase A [Bacillota bacterium]
MPVGRINRIVGGFYYISTEDGRTITAVPRGKLRRSDGIVVGDVVDYELTAPDQGVIEGVHPRRNLLKRPVVANITQVAVVFAHKNPDFNYLLIDRLLVMLAALHLPALLLFNKTDLVDEKTASENAQPYRRIGYTTLCTSTKSGQGREELLAALQKETTTLAGPSGVGKSALINMIVPGVKQPTGAVSAKIGRGRHTTREVRLLALPEGEGFLVDTPGFSQLDLDFISPAELAGCFPEFGAAEQECRFQGCFHDQEPDCGVKAAVAAGKIYPWRYENYLTFLAEVRSWEEQKRQRPRRTRDKGVGHDRRY